MLYTGLSGNKPRMKVFFILLVLIVFGNMNEIRVIYESGNIESTSWKVPVYNFYSQVKNMFVCIW